MKPLFLILALVSCGNSMLETTDAPPDSGYASLTMGTVNTTTHFDNQDAGVISNNDAGTNETNDAGLICRCIINSQCIRDINECP